MSTGRFHIIFDGPALEAHEMNVRDLAPALLAVSDIFDEINRVVFDNKYKVGVNVRASFKTGSFLTELAVYASDIFELFKNENVQAACLMMQVFGVPDIPTLFKGILPFIRWVRRRKITTVVELENDKVRVDQPPRVVPLIVLVHVPDLAQEVVPRGSTLPRGAGWRPALADVAPASYAA